MADSSTSDDRALEVFQQFIRIKSVTFEGPTGPYKEAVDFLLSFAKEVGFTEWEILELFPGKPILILIYRGEDPSLPSVHFNSHYDVVPADTSKWTQDPFAGTKTADGRIYGRGTQDMKCVCIQHIVAVGRVIKAVKENRIPKPKRNINLTFLPDEEVGGIEGAVQFVQTEKFRNLNIGILLDEGLANPKDSYTVFYGERSTWWAKITATGPAGHGSRFIPRSAIEKLQEVIQKIFKFRESQEKLLHDGGGCSHAKAKKLGDVVTINVTALKAFVPGLEINDGFSINCIPTEAIAGIDIRIPPAFPLEDMENLLKEWTKEEGLRYEFYVRAAEHSVSSTDEENKWWTGFESVLKSLGKTFEKEIFPAGTDSRYFREKGVPCFGFSPISNTPILLHDHDEFLSETEFKNGILCFEKIAIKLSNVI